MQTMYGLDFASNKQLVKQKVARAIDVFGKTPGDTGSTGVQVAVLSSKIESLATHCNANRQDKHSRCVLYTVLPSYPFTCFLALLFLSHCALSLCTLVHYFLPIIHH